VKTVGIALLTLNSAPHLPYCLPPLIQSSLKPRILVVDSSSTDGTVELAKQFGVETVVIPRSSFNHGLTRELARNTLQTEIVIMATPDAYACGPDALEKLVKPLMEGKASLAYARQIPHENAGFFESFPRLFNYPAKGHIRSLEDLETFGVYTFFFSDSFGAYLNSALDEIGGFSSVLTGEDTLACAKLLHGGHKVAYVAESLVRHSHCYSLLQEFKRHFDTGLARAEYGEWLKLGGKDSKRGFCYVKAMIKELCREKPYLIPYAFIHAFVKLIGYYAGRYLWNLKSFLTLKIFAIR
jgi:rhamnosyltransferase